MTTSTDKRTQGCFLAYNEDWSGMAVFASEIAALRYGVDHEMRVKRVEFGVDLREAVRADTPKVKPATSAISTPTTAGATS